jgi:cytochrome c oxidase subunit 2
MQTWIPLWLHGETDHASAVDLLFAGLLASSLLVIVLLFFLLLRFAIHYRAGNAEADRDHRIQKSWRWEVSWTAATLVAFLALAVWAAQLYLRLGDAPADALPIYLVGKQWMWKAQHVGGQREINELHLPVGSAVRLIMSSQDVIHSFFIPAFRIKHDVVPGTIETLWFRPRKAGVFHLFCAEYCGTDHSRMTGRIVVMEPAEFAQWLASQDVAGSGGRRCAVVPAIRLQRLSWRRSIRARAGARWALRQAGAAEQRDDRLADERYIRDSILKPRKRIVAGYEPKMPSYQGKISEDELVPLVAYVKSLAEPRGHHDRWAQLSDRRQQPSVLVLHHRPQACGDPLFHRHHAVLLHRGYSRNDDPDRARHAAGRSRYLGCLQSAVHHPRRRDGVVLPHSLGP